MVQSSGTIPTSPWVPGLAASLASPVFAPSLPRWTAVAASSALGRWLPLAVRCRPPRRCPCGFGVRSVCSHRAPQACRRQRATVWSVPRSSRIRVRSQHCRMPVCRTSWAPAGSFARRACASRPHRAASPRRLVWAVCSCRACYSRRTIHLMSLCCGPGHMDSVSGPVSIYGAPTGLSPGALLNMAWSR